MHFAPISLGATIRSMDVNGFIVTDTVHAPNMSLPMHAHENAGLAFVLSGSFREVAGPSVRQCRAETLVIRPPRDPHEDLYGERGAHSLLIEVTPSRLQSLAAAFDSAALIDSSAVAVKLRRVHDEMRLADAFSSLAIEGLLLESFAELARMRTASAGPRVPRWLAAARDYVREHFVDGITLSDVARHVSVHPMHLARSFRSCFGASVGEYLRSTRIEQATRLIATTSRSLADIALEMGYSDQSHLTREFRRVHGTGPGAYRRLRKR